MIRYNFSPNIVAAVKQVVVSKSLVCVLTTDKVIWRQARSC